MHGLYSTVYKYYIHQCSPYCVHSPFVERYIPLLLPGFPQLNTQSLLPQQQFTFKIPSIKTGQQIYNKFPVY